MPFIDQLLCRPAHLLWHLPHLIRSQWNQGAFVHGSVSFPETLSMLPIQCPYDSCGVFIAETALAFTIFHDEFDIPFTLMFGFLLFVKSFHWLASNRIEWMDQRPYPGPPLLFHLRMSALFAILWLTDFIMFLVAVENTLSYGVGGMVPFVSEYLLSSYELRQAGQRGGETTPPWENRSMWVFYIVFITDFLKLTTYLAFFSIIITFYGSPLNIIRDILVGVPTELPHPCHQTVLENTNGPTRPPAASEVPRGPQQQQTAARNAANTCPRNEMGLLGRILGNQNLNQQPPAVQRPFDLAPLPSQGNVGAPNVIHDPPGHMVIQYNIQLPPRQGRLPDDATLVPPAQLQPVQPFIRFEGPGNIWQPWQANDQVPTNTTRSSESASTQTSLASSNPNSPNVNNILNRKPEPTTNPRQEAALAALRRLSGARPPN
ncbi:hypothetical protein L218DRAFT_1042344 [Marasmius fiardii PR-910]|nr:hypothetical protein L218DRAFT_1042344 [Marasmius fiardii PR-910]